MRDTPAMSAEESLLLIDVTVDVESEVRCSKPQYAARLEHAVGFPQPCDGRIRLEMFQKMFRVDPTEGFGRYRKAFRGVVLQVIQIFVYAGDTVFTRLVLVSVANAAIVGIELTRKQVQTRTTVQPM